MISRYAYYANSEYDVMIDKPNGAYIFDKRRGKYFFDDDINALDKMSKVDTFVKVEEVKINMLDIVFYFSFFCSLLSICIFVFLAITELQSFIHIERLHIFQGIGIILINYFLHEYAHWLTMKCFGRSPGRFALRYTSGSIGLTLDTSSAYLLPKFRRFAVFYSGVMVNILIVTAWVLLFPQWRFSVVFTVVLIVVNLIPTKIPRTDGYNIVRYVISKKP